MTRQTSGEGKNHMYHGEVGYDHDWSDTHMLQLTFGFSKRNGDNDNIYDDQMVWPEHTLSISTYYRPTTDVIQRIRYQGDDGLMYSTSENVTKNQRAGVELIVKDKLFRILDLTTTVNGYYYKLDGFSYNIMGQTITGESDENFSWDARLLASLILPYDISQQTTGNYRSRGVITQGYRKANGSVDLGLRKTFLNKTLALAINWRDVFKLARRVQHPPLRELHLERHLHPSPEELA